MTGGTLDSPMGPPVDECPSTWGFGFSASDACEQGDRKRSRGLLTNSVEELINVSYGQERKAMHLAEM